jgi:hypothetical protein
MILHKEFIKKWKKKTIAQLAIFAEADHAAAEERFVSSARSM